jgi:fructose transport system permease protein
VGMLQNGLTIVGVDALYQDIAIGLLVILAVMLDRLQRGRSVR